MHKIIIPKDKQKEITLSINQSIYNLSDEERDFCKLFVFGCDEFKQGNVARSYTKAFNNNNSSAYNTLSYRLFEDTDISNYIAELSKKAFGKDFLFDTELTRIAFNSLKDENRLKAIEQRNKILKRIGSDQQQLPTQITINMNTVDDKGNTINNGMNEVVDAEEALIKKCKG